MNHEDLCTGNIITLTEVLDARENRAALQKEMLDSLPPENSALICLTLNIVGPVKVFPYTIPAYETGLAMIRECLLLLGADITAFREIRENTGYEAFFAVTAPSACDISFSASGLCSPRINFAGFPSICKYQLTLLEESHPLGRLMDMDVLGPTGEKVSRTELGFSERTCLLCGNPAFLCGRSRTHTASELVTREIRIIRDFFTERFSNHVGLLMQKALLYEVNTTLKPGLVDRVHNGSHRDMNHRSFVDSAYGLTPYFIQVTRMGMEFALNQKSGADSRMLSELFSSIRPLGMEAEKTMRQVAGANTHKGMIFSGGILCCALGYDMVSSPGKLPFSLRYTNPHEYFPRLQYIIRQMLTHLMDDYTALDSAHASSHGEHLYLKYKVKGIRGEAMEGFPALFDMGFPLFTRLLAHGFSLNQSGCILLLHYMAKTEDSNIIARSSYEKARQIRSELERFLKDSDYEEQMSILPALDAYFIRENISPGGSADMLALTYFLYFMSVLPCKWD